MTHPRWTSRKFLMACVTIIITVVAGFGYDLDPEFIATMVGAEGALWIVIEGIVDIVNKS